LLTGAGRARELLLLLETPRLAAAAVSCLK
jgi:hypothetical protein